MLTQLARPAINSMNAKLFLYAVVTSVFVVSGCASTPLEADKGSIKKRKHLINEVCEIGRKDIGTYVTATTVIGDNVTAGDITTRAEIPLDKYYSAIAVPIRDKVLHSYVGPGTCKKWFTDFYGRSYFIVNYFSDCENTEKYELQDVYGIARADTLESAEQYAEENCNNSIKRKIIQHPELRRYRDTLQCIVRSKSACS